MEFYSDEVAKVVADTMDNYLVFERIVKCKLKISKTTSSNFVHRIQPTCLLIP